MYQERWQEQIQSGNGRTFASQSHNGEAMVIDSDEKIFVMDIEDLHFLATMELEDG